MQGRANQPYIAPMNLTISQVLAQMGMDSTVDRVLDVTRARRIASPRQRRALRERDRGCVFPGCAAPVGWTDAHHTPPFEQSHHTTLDELVLLCRFHHHQVHEGGFTLTRHQRSGHITVLRPDDTPLPHAPHGHQIPEPAEHTAGPAPPGHPANTSAPPGDRASAPAPASASQPPPSRPPSRFRPLTRRPSAEAEDAA